MYLYQNIPCSCVRLPSKQAKWKRENLSDKMMLCPSSTFVLGTPKAGTMKPSFHSSTCLLTALSVGSKSHTGLQSTKVVQSLGGPQETTGNDCFSRQAFSKGLHLQKKAFHPFNTSFSEAGLSHWCFPEWLDWLTVEFQGPSCIFLPSTRIPGTCCPARFCLFISFCFILFYMCARDPNSGSHEFVATTLPAQPSPHQCV